MGEREEREGAASLLTEREAVIKWRHSQRFSLVAVGVGGWARAHPGKKITAGCIACT